MGYQNLDYQNLDFHKFSYAERLKQLKRHLKGSSMFPLKMRTIALVAIGWVGRMTSDITMNLNLHDANHTGYLWKYYLHTYLVLCIKFGASVFNSFGDRNRWIFTTQSHTHTHTHTLTYVRTDQFLKKKSHFGIQETSKINKSCENSRSRVLDKNNTSII